MLHGMLEHAVGHDATHTDLAPHRASRLSTARGSMRYRWGREVRSGPAVLFHRLTEPHTLPKLSMPCLMRLRSPVECVFFGGCESGDGCKWLRHRCIVNKTSLQRLVVHRTQDKGSHADGNHATHKDEKQQCWYGVTDAPLDDGLLYMDATQVQTMYAAYIRSVCATYLALCRCIFNGAS